MPGHSAPPATSTTHQLIAQPRKVRLSFRKRSTDVEKAAQHDWRFATTAREKLVRVLGLAQISQKRRNSPSGPRRRALAADALHRAPRERAPGGFPGAPVPGRRLNWRSLGSGNNYGSCSCSWALRHPRPRSSTIMAMSFVVSATRRHSRPQRKIPAFFGLSALSQEHELISRA